jgi:hypothetical protein
LSQAGRFRPDQEDRMSGTTIGIIVVVVVVVAALAIWLVTIMRAAQHPQQEHPQRDPLHGVVQGGQHVGGGRSVAPTRDAPVPEGGGDPPSAQQQDEATHAEQAGRNGDRDAMDR